MSHATAQILQWYTDGCIMAHMWMSHVTQINNSCRIYDVACHTYECIKSHVWMRQVTIMNEI